MKTGVFVTGTDTGVGKTWVSSRLLATAIRSGKNAGYWKPVQTGEDCDTRTVREQVSLGRANFAEPAYRFRAPQAPLRAAREEGASIDLEKIVQRWDQLDERHWIVEGAGGLLVPLTERETIRELARALRLPLVVVASTRLGTINHTLLTLEAAHSAGLRVERVILNRGVDRDNDDSRSECAALAAILREFAPEEVFTDART